MVLVWNPLKIYISAFFPLKMIMITCYSKVWSEELQPGCCLDSCQPCQFSSQDSNHNLHFNEPQVNCKHIQDREALVQVLCSVQTSRSVVSNSFQSHEPQHAMLDKLFLFQLFKSLRKSICFGKIALKNLKRYTKSSSKEIMQKHF